MDENERILTVVDHMTNSYYKEKYSRLLLQGRWLREAGFVAGNRVSVGVENENNKPQLIIKLID